MSLARHLDHLAVYRAGAVRVVPRQGDAEDLLDDGGGLEASFEAIGRGPLLEVFRDATVQEVLLADGELEVSARREQSGARLVVKWGEDVVVDEATPLPPVQPLAKGPWFRPDPESVVPASKVKEALADSSKPLFAVSDGSELQWFTRGAHGPGTGQMLLRGSIQPLFPEDLGSVAFRKVHGTRWAYVGGELGGGISSVALVAALANQGLLGFFGATGLPLAEVQAALGRLRDLCPGDAPWGCGLPHWPDDPDVEMRFVEEVLLGGGVKRVSAGAFQTPTTALLRFRYSGAREAADGRAVAPHKVFARASRPEVAERFLRPPTVVALRELVQRGFLTADEARIAERLPIAEDLIAEADSGGFTDHRPLHVVLPVLCTLRNRIAEEEAYTDVWPRVGSAGGIGTAASAWTAFSLGADFVVVGSVHQTAVEAELPRSAKMMLSTCSSTDVATAPTSQRFEQGMPVQVLGRGTVYANRSRLLFEVWRQNPSWEAVGAAERQNLEAEVFKRPFEALLDEARAGWAELYPAAVAKAAIDPKAAMSLAFRWHLDCCARWARQGFNERKADWQIWCGPAMGAFNQWVASGPLAALDRRPVLAIAHAITAGAAAHARVASARAQGLPIPLDADDLPAGVEDL